MIRQRLLQLHDDIAQTALRCGRKPDEIKLVAVSKLFPVSAIKEAYAAGQRLFGENYLQEAARKRAALPDDLKIHLIGHLQSNKAKTASEIFSLIETIDRFKIAATLDKHLASQQRVLEVFIQVNIGLDPNKAGVLPDQTVTLASQIADLGSLKVRGLMTIPPFHQDPAESRPYYRSLRKLSETLVQHNLFHGTDRPELSMGMSHDYQVAIEEGATIIRIGTALFGERPQ